ncbi:MAG: M1 family aminopeptidase [Acidobacteriota bacterium]
MAAMAMLASGQARRSDARIDIQKYTIDATVDPAAQTLRAVVKVDFTPIDDASDITFGLNNALELHSVVDGAGEAVQTQKSVTDMTIRVTANKPFAKGQAASLTFDYAGKLTGAEESPVWGIKFAAIHPDYAYLMYPGRWFPVYDYGIERFRADVKVSVPGGYRVVGSGIESAGLDAAGGGFFKFDFSQESFPGSIAIVKGDPEKINAGGMDGSFYFRTDPKMAAMYGAEIGHATEYFTGIFGLPPSRKIAVIETEAGSPNGYSAPGLIFLSPGTIGSQVNKRVVANQVARQWWGTLVSPASRNHMWIQNGMARYAEILYAEETDGKAAANTLIHETYIEALTVQQPPVIQSGRLEDYSPEYWAVTAGKGAATLHMLRGLVGDEKFLAILKAIPEQYAWKTVSTDQVKDVAEKITGENLTGFFLQWIESSGAPEFTMEYTTFRTKDGFRVNGKITQDLDLFRMPVKLRIETEGNPEEKTVVVSGTSTEFALDTFGKPKDIVLDPGGEVLRYDDDMRVAVAIRRGEQFVEIAEYGDAIAEYEKALQVKRNSSLAHYRVAEVYYLQNNLQQAANAFRDVLSGDLVPMWVEVWSHIYLGKIFDITGDRTRAVNEYRQAVRTRDNTQGALDEAEKYLATPFERQRVSN